MGEIGAVGHPFDSGDPVVGGPNPSTRQCARARRCSQTSTTIAQSDEEFVEKRAAGLGENPSILKIQLSNGWIFFTHDL